MNHLRVGKRGVEGFPLRLLISLVVLGFVLITSLTVINVFQDFKSHSLIHNSANDLLRMLSVLSNNDYDSFTHVELVIPSDSYLFIDNSSDELVINWKGNITRESVGFDVKNSLNLTPGVYDLRLYYGDMDWSEIKNNTLVYK